MHGSEGGGPAGLPTPIQGENRSQGRSQGEGRVSLCLAGGLVLHQNAVAPPAAPCALERCHVPWNGMAGDVDVRGPGAGARGE